jgi:hypothetical protein
LHPGHLFTIEHDQKWASLVRKELEIKGLTGDVTVIEAPLKASPFLEEQCELQAKRVEYKWYDTEVLDEQLPASGIDLIIVDGPPAYREQYRLARFPAVPFLATKLAKNCTIVLDDINRAGEKTVADAWERQTSFRFKSLRHRGNVAVAQRGEVFNI